jgi:hypothetical protein
MEGCIGSKEYEKILRVFMLKAAYDLVKSLDKEVQNSLASCCVIVRKAQIKNDTEFGYKEEVKTGILKKIHFVYLRSIEDLTSFLWAHLTCDKPVIAGIFVDCIEQYFGGNSGPTQIDSSSRRAAAQSRSSSICCFSSARRRCRRSRK